MKMRIILSLLLGMVLLITLSSCESKQSELSESALPTNSEAQQIILPTDTVKDTSVNDEFQAYVDKWKLSGLIPENCTMTTEQQEEFMKYFQRFDEVTRGYIILLLQGIADNTITLDDDTNTIYLTSCQYYLYDMNQDEIPEFILMTGGDEAGYKYTVYTIVEDKLINCGELNGSHSSLYSSDGTGKFVRYKGHMGVYHIDVSTLEGTMLITKTIADGVLDYDKNEDYPELDKYSYGDYDQSMVFSYIPALFLVPAG